MKITKQECNQARKRGKRGANSIPIALNLLTHSAYLLVFRQFCLENKISVQAGLDLLMIFSNPGCSRTKLALLNPLDNYQNVQTRILTLSKRGLVESVGKTLRVSVKGLQALQRLEIDPTLDLYWLDLQDRIRRSEEWRVKRLSRAPKK